MVIENNGLFSAYEVDEVERDVDANEAKRDDSRRNRVFCKDCKKRETMESFPTTESWTHTIHSYDSPQRDDCEKCRALAARKLLNDKMKEAWLDFSSHSTFHGFKMCIGDYPRWRKLTWTLIVIATIALFVEKFCESMFEFYRYPFNTVTILEYNKTLTFPAVTICNHNDVRMSVLNGTLPDEVFKLRQMYGKEDERYKALRSNVTHKEMKVVEGAAHRQEELIYDCMWRNSVPCSHKNFSQFTTADGDTCYTINGENQSPPFMVDKTGMKNGLRLTLHSQVFDYYRDVHHAGFSVILHDQSETPFRMQGFTAPPGRVTYVELKLTKVKNLPPPYKTSCGDPVLKYFDTYSRSKCYLDTLTQDVIKKCNCRDWFMPAKEVPNCPDMEAFLCVWDNWQYFDTNKTFYQKCPVSCDLTEYETSMSYAMFPSNSYADEWALNESFPGKSKAAKRQFIRDNFVEIVIYYEDLNYYLVSQVPTYDTMDFLGDIGGQVGLFLGASSLTALEVLDFIYELFRLLYLYGLKKRKLEEEESLTQENTQAMETKV